MITHVERFNGGTLRRYHHQSRAILVTAVNEWTGHKFASVIPASCCHISVDIDRQRAAKMLREWRAAQ